MSASLCLWISALLSVSVLRFFFFLFDFGYDRRVHAALGDEHGALPVHFDEQALARLIDECDRAEHDAHARPGGGYALPTFLKLVDPRAGELSLQIQDGARRSHADSDFQHDRLIPDYFPMNNRF